MAFLKLKNFGGGERNYFSSGVQIIFDTATNLYGENGLNPKIGYNREIFSNVQLRYETRYHTRSEDSAGINIIYDVRTPTARPGPGLVSFSRGP